MSPATADAMEAFTSSEGALALAVTVIAGVLGARLLARVRGAAPALLAYAGALALLWLGRQGLVRWGPALEAPTLLRLAGAAMLVFGLVGASRAAQALVGADAGVRWKLLGGLGLVLLGQLLRGPSGPGLAGVVVAAAVLGWVGARGGHPNG